jgi:exopolysaccharide biosynthesis polyprenyl glycosylphosphotransferase
MPEAARGDERDWAGLSVAERYRASLGHRAAAPAPDAVMRPFRTRLIATDAVLLALVTLLGLLLSSRQSIWAVSPVLAVWAMPAVISVLWLGLLLLRGSYDQRFIGVGAEEIRRVVSATLITFAVVAGVSYLVRADISRAYAFVSLPLGLLLIVVARFAWRGWLYRQRARRSFMHRTVVVGSGPAADELLARLTSDYYAGYLVAARVPVSTPLAQDTEAWLDHLDDVLDDTQAQALALAPSDSLSADLVRNMAWRLEGRGIDLLIAPAIMDITGPRLSVRPAAGLPLLHLDEAALSRPQRFSKRLLDLVVAVAAAVVLLPVMAVIAVAVRTTSKGPAIFRQSRIGLLGQPFTLLKFRTMVANAEAQQADLREQHRLDSPLFKLDDDPRITRVGRVLRRWSLDELPQLFNVIGGSMSLVGPRPHPFADVDRYELAAYRRLAIKPGLTGLWQVRGRSDLDWAEALQLDLYYVETWSLSGDIVLLARTIGAVVRGRGAR